MTCFIKIIFSLLVLVNFSSALAMGKNYRKPPENVLKDHYDAFSMNQVAPAHNLRMFEGIPDERPLGRISILGTHNSASTKCGIFLDSCRTQTLSIPEQLKLGVRFFDFRLKHVARGKLQFYHGAFQIPGSFLSTALTQINDFLNANSTEFVLIKIQNEDYSQRAYDDIDGMSFAAAVKENLIPFKDLLLNNATDSHNLKLKQLRKKIVIFSAYEGAYIDYNFPAFYYKYNRYGDGIQDEYNMENNWSLYNKIQKTYDHLDKANRYYEKNDSNRAMFFNYLTGSGGSFPYFVAGGRSHGATNAPHLLTGATETSTGINRNKWPIFPRVSCTAGPGWICSIAFGGTNEAMASKILRDGNYKFGGVIVADFPGAKLAEAVKLLNRNSSRDGR